MYELENQSASSIYRSGTALSITSPQLTMPRYFIEVAYQGTRYSGFQVQQNANSVQEEVEKAFAIYYRHQVALTGSSRTDAGVHALGNFFHADLQTLARAEDLYRLNAILPPDIVLIRLYLVPQNAHCRYDAHFREYSYFIYQQKDPFLRDRAYYYPFPRDFAALHSTAEIISRHVHFGSFAKRNSQAKTFNCQILASSWVKTDKCLVYQVKANRFLRGMVRGLVGTMLLAGRGKISLDEFENIISAQESSRTDFSVPGHALFLVKIGYPLSLTANPIPG